MLLFARLRLFGEHLRHVTDRRLPRGASCALSVGAQAHAPQMVAMEIIQAARASCASADSYWLPVQHEIFFERPGAGFFSLALRYTRWSLQ